MAWEQLLWRCHSMCWFRPIFICAVCPGFSERRCTLYAATSGASTKLPSGVCTYKGILSVLCISHSSTLALSEANVPTFRIRENRTSEHPPARSPIVTLYLNQIRATLCCLRIALVGRTCGPHAGASERARNPLLEITRAWMTSPVRIGEYSDFARRGT